jgi:hypothetical protein
MRDNKERKCTAFTLSVNINKGSLVEELADTLNLGEPSSQRVD